MSLPTPVQAGLIPEALAGKDVMAQARTGTGKTAAFGIPTLEQLRPRREAGGPQALVLVPTRELGGAGPRRDRQARPRPPRRRRGGLRRQTDPATDREAEAGGRHRRGHARPRARSPRPRDTQFDGTADASCSTKPTGCSTSGFDRTSRRFSASAPRAADAAA